jgi:MFS family permease
LCEVDREVRSSGDEGRELVTAADYTPRRVIFAYLSTSGLFTLATSLIWAINTIFLIQRGGLTLFQVMLVNTVYLIAQMLCEVPTGVIADTIGRKASYLLSIATIIVSTVLYVLTPILGWGIGGFMVASALIGLGFTFQTGAVDAWLVDALDAAGWTGPKEKVFAWGGMAFGAAMVAGSLLGGFLGQVNLVIPYVVRTVVLVAAFVLVLFLVRDSGFEPRPLHFSNFGSETKTILNAGVQYGWGSGVVRPLMFVSLVTGGVGMFAFYSWQPYVLELLGRPSAVWVLGVVQAGSSVAMIGGNSLVRMVMREGASRRDPARVLALGSIAAAVLVLAIGGVGLLRLGPGALPAAAAIVLWLLWSVVFGLLGPVRSGFVNEHIPSAQRATVLSLDSLFADVGGSLGQPALGWIATRFSIGLAWVMGSAFFAAAAPLYAMAGRAAHTRATIGEPADLDS